MLIQHSVLYIIAKLLPGLFGLLTTAALTRLLDPHEYGLFGLALVIMSLGSTILFDWLGLSFLRFYQARRDDPRVVTTFVSMFVALVVISAVALGVAWIGGALPADLVGIYIVGLIMVWTYAWFELVSRLAVAEFRPINNLGMNFGRSLLILVGATTAAWLTESPLWTAIATAAGMFASTFFVGVPIARPSWHRFDRDLARSVLLFGAPIAASMTMGSLVSGGTRALVELLDSARALGVYTAAFVLVQNTLGVMAAGIAAAGYSLAVRAVDGGDPDAARRQLLANGALLLAVLAPASLGIALAGNSIATTLVGSKFTSGVAPLMPWMAAGTLFGCLRAHYLDHAFQLGHRPQLQIWVTGLAGIIAIALCIYLIPLEGPIGAAIAVTVSMVVSCVHAWIAGRYAYPLPLPIAAGIRVGICCAIMALVMVGLPDTGWTGLALRIGLGSAAYALSAVAVNLLDARERVAGLVKRAIRWRAASRGDATLKKVW